MLRVLGDRILVKELESDDKTDSGLYLPGGKQDGINEGEVVSLGAGKLKEGKTHEFTVKKGDKVLFIGESTNYPTITEMGKTYRLMQESEVLAILED